VNQGYIVHMTGTFRRWFDGLRDARAQDRIATRVRRIEQGSLGDYRPVGDGVSELRLDYGPGYRIYFPVRRLEIVILLAGGDKGSQARDIRAAQLLAKEW